MVTLWLRTRIYTSPFNLAAKKIWYHKSSPASKFSMPSAGGSKKLRYIFWSEWVIIFPYYARSLHRPAAVAFHELALLYICNTFVDLQALETSTPYSDEEVKEQVQARMWRGKLTSH